MKEIFIRVYRYIFARKVFYKFNLHIYKVALRGIGVLNSEGPEVTGEKYLFEKILSKLDIETVFDIGASRGNYSKMVKKHFPKADIYAFEPHPDSFRILKKVSKKYSFNAYNLGLSDKKGNGTLWDFRKESDMNLTFPSIYKEVIEQVHKSDAKSRKVMFTTLEEFVKNVSVKEVGLLKIDTEGSEYKILKGCRNLLKDKKIKVIQFEFNEMNVISRVFMKDFIDLLQGYKIFRLQIDGLIPIDKYDPKTHEIFAFQNIVAFNPKVAKKLNL